MIFDEKVLYTDCLLVKPIEDKDKVLELDEDDIDNEGQDVNITPTGIAQELEPVAKPPAQSVNL